MWMGPIFDPLQIFRTKCSIKNKLIFRKNKAIVCKGVPGPTKKIRSQHYWKHPPRILKTQSPLNLNFSGLFYTHKIISLVSNLKLLEDCRAFLNCRINGIMLKKEAPQAKFFIATAASLRASEDGIHCFALRYWTGSWSFCAFVCLSEFSFRLHCYSVNFAAR